MLVKHCSLSVCQALRYNEIFVRFLFQETKRQIPLLSSSNYGHRLAAVLEPFARSHVRVEHVQKGFYYKRGTGLPPVTD